MSKLVIVEGPDGAGKTTAARAIAAQLNARYVHCGVYPHVSRGLARLYVEAMLPALLGYQDVVLDRAWPSEAIYGAARRGGKDRLSTRACMLDRIALRCEAHLLLCLPSFETCYRAFRRRSNEEYLCNEAQLRAVHTGYADLHCATALPIEVFDYAECDTLDYPTSIVSEAHPFDWVTAGNLRAPIVLVGETLAELKDQDPLFRAPFVSFSNAGCSLWLTTQLASAGISECDLLWVNSDDPRMIDAIMLHPRRCVIALGTEALSRLNQFLLPTTQQTLTTVQHPQRAKRFNHNQPYELIKLIHEVLK